MGKLREIKGVFGNVGSIITFQVGSDDAEHLAEQLGKYPGQITPENLTGLPKFTACVRLLIDGMPSKPFSMQTLPPPINEIDPERAEIIRRVTQRSFTSFSKPPEGSGNLPEFIIPTRAVAGITSLSNYLDNGLDGPHSTTKEPAINRWRFIVQCHLPTCAMCATASDRFLSE